MFGRRQIRERCVTHTYAFLQNPIDEDIAIKNLISSVLRLQDLYYLYLSFLRHLKPMAEHKIEIEAGKRNYNPEVKLQLSYILDHPFLLELESNDRLSTAIEKNKNLRWDIHESLPNTIFQKIWKAKIFKDFVSLENPSHDEKMRFLGKIFLRYVAESENFQEYLADRDMYWEDDAHIINSMVQNTISSFSEGNEGIKFISIFKDKEDEDFLEKLFLKTIKNRQSLTEKITELASNWDIERISKIDIAILSCGMAELQYFPETHARIILNEYVEISKVYSSEKAPQFINGILDAFAKQINRPS